MSIELTTNMTVSDWVSKSIADPSWNPRGEENYKVEELANLIAIHGIIDAPTVRRLTDAEKEIHPGAEYFVTDGNRRLAACRHIQATNTTAWERIGKQTLFIPVESGKEADYLTRAIISGTQRENLTPGERLFAFVRLAEALKAANPFALKSAWLQKYGVAPSTAAGYSGLATLVGEARKHAQVAATKEDDAEQNVLRLEFEDEPNVTELEAFRTMLSKAREDRLKFQRFESYVRESRITPSDYVHLSSRKEFSQAGYIAQITALSELGEATNKAEVLRQKKGKETEEEASARIAEEAQKAAQLVRTLLTSKTVAPEVAQAIAQAVQQQATEEQKAGGEKIQTIEPTPTETPKAEETNTPRTQDTPKQEETPKVDAQNTEQTKRNADLPTAKPLTLPPVEAECAVELISILGRIMARNSTPCEGGSFVMVTDKERDDWASCGPVISTIQSLYVKATGDNK